ncbi:YwqG family protein [Chondrinema litorale]|uniref:YwqG family protein n=1 Tax=Chondrinema litorale TaxID=2994555 RepID=UPI002543689F|nr:YwqG family protein [Chondrinema litorale]UZR99194.1 YwqG family protein [Chondrinema litorale]
MEFPEELKEYQHIIEQSKLDYINVEITNGEIDIPITTSKLGGNPYLPIGIDYPLDNEGNPMMLLAQLNFAEIPHIPDYPVTGLLQFFIALDDLYGLNFNNPTRQEGFKVIYHKEIKNSGLQTDFSLIEDLLKSDDVYPVLTGEYKLTFKKDVCYVPVSDVHFEEFFGQSSFDFFESFDDPDTAWKVYSDYCSSVGHRIGGYAYFTQEDPRIWKKTLREYQLLFQLDSEDKFLMWGDVGVGNFFIKKEALKKLDFSDVLYNWDCG